MSKVLELLDAMNKGKITNLDVIDILIKSDEKFIKHINNILTEKDKRISELEAENDLVRNTKINTNKMECIHLQAEILELKEELSLTEKALELVCKELHVELENPDNELYTKTNDEMTDYFKNKAKEMMKSEN